MHLGGSGSGFVSTLARGAEWYKMPRGLAVMGAAFGAIIALFLKMKKVETKK